MPKPTANGKGSRKKLKTVPNISQRSRGTNIIATTTAAILPDQYITPPAREIRPTQTPQTPVQGLSHPSSSANDVRQFPPPGVLFPDLNSRPPQINGSRSLPQLHANSTNPHATSSPAENSVPESPLQNSHAQSSEGHNFEDEDEEIPVTPELQADTLRDLNALLSVPDRHKFVKLLSPDEKTPNSTWFDRDKKQSLVRAITRVFCGTFDKPYYNWSCVPREKVERWFLEFAKTHTWDPLITGTVQANFETIVQRRLKNMVSNARTSGERPKWIDEILWTRMVTHWETEEQQQRSETYSTCHMSDRDGHGPHRHVTGPKSYIEIQREMVVEKGRPVSLGEVFVRAHTKKDGTYIDQKAERIANTYKKNLEQKLAELGVETSDGSDGGTQPRELTTDDYDQIFLKSTELDAQGNPFGLGSLKDIVGKRKHPEESSAFVALQDQLKETQRQLADIAAREERQARVLEEQKQMLVKMSRMSQFMRAIQPAYLDFLATQPQATPGTNPIPLSTSPSATTTR